VLFEVPLLGRLELQYYGQVCRDKNSKGLMSLNQQTWEGKLLFVLRKMPEQEDVKESAPNFGLYTW